MDKRTIIVLVITMAMLFVFQTYFMPKETPQQKPQTQTQPAPPPPDTSKPAEKAGQQAPGAAPGTTAPSDATTGKKAARTIAVSTPYLDVTLTDLGGGISSVKLKKYKATVKGPEEKEIVENVAPYSYNPTVYQNGVQDKVYFKADREKLNVTDTSATLTMTGNLPDGTRIKKTYTFYPDTYTIGLALEAEPKTQGLHADFAVISDKNESSYVFKGPFVFNGKSLNHIDKIKETLNFSSDYQYAGFDEGFFTFIYIPAGPAKPALSIGKTDTNIPYIRLASGTNTLSGKLYFGPKKGDILASLNIKAEKIIDFGWFDVIAKPLVWLLDFFNRFTHNYGIDIILLTILIKIIFHPLSVMSFKNMAKMQAVQPEIKKLQEKYKGDKARLNQELMAIYKSRGVNPMSGCLPMLPQIPVFFALYKALSGAIELRHAPFLWWINDLSAPEDLFSLTVMGYTLPIRLLPIIMGATQVIQQKMTPTSADPMQQKMMMFMPIVFTFIFWGFPSGLVLYWLVYNVASIAQQYYINKKMKK
ncbi:MAG: membrane protein insertase YidC [Syntrophorhabdaceae bacterium]|nr:membrane protein insertase YidC [Syntrophorhabdaceae bacterium]MDD4196739.1 membrane protein insertase YidC [Syntrophorhabdaceae bacterium]